MPFNLGNKKIIIIIFLLMSVCHVQKPHFSISANTFLRLLLNSVTKYSTFGGVSLNFTLLKIPSFTSSFNCSVSAFLEIEGMRAEISPNRSGYATFDRT